MVRIIYAPPSHAYLHARVWIGFSPTFPRSELDAVADCDLPSAMSRTACDWVSAHREDFERARANRRTEFEAQMSGQMSDPHSSSHAAQEPQQRNTTRPPSFKLVASIAGWELKSPCAITGWLEPPRWLVVYRAPTKEKIDNIKECLIRQVDIQGVPPVLMQSCSFTYACVPAAKLSVPERAVSDREIEKILEGRSSNVWGMAILHEAARLERLLDGKGPLVLPRPPDKNQTNISEPEPKPPEQPHDEPEAVSPQEPARESQREKQRARLARALFHLKDHPDATDTELATVAGVNRSTIGRWEEIKRAREAIRQGAGKKPDGFIRRNRGGTSDLEAALDAESEEDE